MPGGVVQGQDFQPLPGSGGSWVWEGSGKSKNGRDGAQPPDHKLIQGSGCGRVRAPIGEGSCKGTIHGLDPDAWVPGAGGHGGACGLF